MDILRMETISLNQVVIGSVFDPARRFGSRRSAVRRVVLDPAVLRRIVRRRENESVRLADPATDIVGQDGSRDRRRGRGAAVFLNAGLDAVGRQDFQRGALCGT